MWTTIALLTALGAAPDASGLSLSNVRSTHGLLGPQRSNESIAPGDNLFLSFDINGIRVDPEGKVRYSMAIELSDSAGKVVFRQLPKEQEARASLGGDSVPAYAHLSVGLDTPAGDYRMKVVVKDLATGQEQSLTRDVKVLPKDFALVRTTVTVDPDAHYSAAVFSCGQGVWVHASAVGFGRGGNKQPNVVFEMRVLDAGGKPTTNAMTGTPPKDLPADVAGLQLGFPLTLNRSGKFTVELQATDRVSGKKASTSFPIVVQGAAEK
ncbi:MAG TPA: hypothetical protein VH592_00015 [Gemmataceae bacterium]|jgi:hypothetical protein